MAAESSTRHIYEQRINRVLAHISLHIGDDLDYETLCEISGFSRYHFHRLFKALTGETLGEFIRRLRLEKAAYQLIYNLHASITDIAFSLNFSSSQNFARSFRERFGMTPAEYRKKFAAKEMIPPGESSKRIDLVNNNALISGGGFAIPERMYIGESISIRKLSRIRAACIHRKGFYIPGNIISAFNTLINWAAPRELVNETTRFFTVFWDNNAVTSWENCRFDACIEVPYDFRISQPAHELVIDEGRYAVYSCDVGNYDFYTHWNGFLGGWFPESGFQPADGPSFEFYDNFLEKSPRFIRTEICIPIRDLSE
jgi:AraC family transcriptional regulator